MKASIPTALVMLCSLLPLTAPVAGLAAPDRAELQFFETEIRPLLAASCFECHGSEKQKGGLRLDHIEHIRAGGSEYGPAITPDEPAGSPLLLAVGHTDADLQMPPEERLSPAQVEQLRRWIEMGAPWPDEAVDGEIARAPGTLTEEDREWWSFQPVEDPPPPDNELFANPTPVDRFLGARLEEMGLEPSPAADQREWVRRLYFVLHGLPPSADQVNRYLEDKRPDADRRLVDELLASPRFGERMAQHWLDLVRYAESDGYRQDAYRPEVWPYRDYVIRSFNEDKPYDQFIREQLAGDEIAPEDPETRIATAFLRHTIYEWNQRDAEGQWRLILNEITDVTADVFLGLSVQCAQCHDHKFDPILQKDYYRLQAFLNNLTWEDDAYHATEAEVQTYLRELEKWETATAEVRRRIDAIVEPRIAANQKSAAEKFPEEVQAMYRKAAVDRTPYEEQVSRLVERQVRYERTRFSSAKLPSEEQKKLAAARKELSEWDHLRPKEPMKAFIVGETGRPAAPASFTTRRDGRVEIQPGFLSVLDPSDASLPSVSPDDGSSGRRSVLAEWLTEPDHPLTARVMTNRVWQHVFGTGIVATASDYGRLGELPTHPELLDWLTTRFVESGWRLKPLYRQLVLSQAFRQTSRREPSQLEAERDPSNRLLWKYPAQRLDAEQLRDAMLAASGELDLKMGGAGVAATTNRRSIYTKKLRNSPDSLLGGLDAPTGFSSTPERLATTTATQSLMLFNGEWTLKRAAALSQSLADLPSPEEQVTGAFESTLGRSPTPEEASHALQFLLTQISEIQRSRSGRPQSDTPVVSTRSVFPPLAAAWADSDHALQLRPGTAHEKLRVSTSDLEPDAFLIEAVIQLDSLYPDATVRTIASRWNNQKTHAGWSFGVTSAKSAYQPNNLIIQLNGKDFQDSLRYEVVASDLRIPVGKPYYVAAQLRNRPPKDQPHGGTITFHALDLSKEGAEPQTVTVSHEVVDGYVNPEFDLHLGGRHLQARHLWDGNIARLRLGAVDETRLTSPSSPATASLFELSAGLIQDGRASGLSWVGTAEGGRGSTPLPSEQEALKDLCHVLLNSNEFFYLY